MGAVLCEMSDRKSEYSAQRYCHECQAQARVRLRIQTYIVEVECSVCRAGYQLQRY